MLASKSRLLQRDAAQNELPQVYHLEFISYNVPIIYNCTVYIVIMSD